jgi:hypothetical protein
MKIINSYPQQFGEAGRDTVSDDDEKSPLAAATAVATTAASAKLFLRFYLIGKKHCASWAAKEPAYVDRNSFAQTHSDSDSRVKAARNDVR